MKNLWNNADAQLCDGDLLKLRVYTSRLLGQEEDLVLHGGGNTSVKTKESNIFGEEEEIIYVKGSGWDLSTIESQGFAPVKLNTLLQMAELESLSDVDMVKYQRAAMTDPGAPNPSVEAILHANIPYVFVDHTHADAVVTISNTPNGEQRIKEIYGDRMLIVPYVMPGFILAKEVYRMTRSLDWNSIEGMILLNHGVFTFHDDAKVSYDKMIEVVTIAEEYLNKHVSITLPPAPEGKLDTLKIATIRKTVSDVWKQPVLAMLNNSQYNFAFSQLSDLEIILNRGPLTPDHIIRTKRTPVTLGDDPVQDINQYAKNYIEYFNEFNSGDLICLDASPRWAVWKGHGTLTFGNTVKSNTIIHDIARHTMQAIHRAEQLGGWQALPQSDLFEMEYWELEQLKLKKGAAQKSFAGKIALVTGAASGIGKACVELLVKEGAVVAALDIDPSIKSLFDCSEVLGLQCDVTKREELSESIEATVAHFGGLDMLVANAGIFPESFSIEAMDMNVWQKTMDINLSSQQMLIQLSIPYLSLGIDPSIVIMGSKNVLAPGPGAAAYSVAKAGLTQLARIAALELGPKGIRVNSLHPNAIYDTGIWTEEVLSQRAANYGMTIEEYKTNNLLKVQLKATDVAGVVVQLLGKNFSKITGAQIPVDGGTNRTI